MALADLDPRGESRSNGGSASADSAGIRSASGQRGFAPRGFGVYVSACGIRLLPGFYFVGFSGDSLSFWVGWTVVSADLDIRRGILL